MSVKCVVFDTENVVQLSPIQIDAKQNRLKELQLLLGLSRVTAYINRFFYLHMSSIMLEK